jgi:hypothetical protein
MEIEGGCYCGEVRYRAEGDPAFRGQCFCRECQYISGGDSNLALGMPEAGFGWTKGSPRAFRRADLESPVTREFCESCGTHLVSRPPSLKGVVLLKVGTLDDPSVFEGPQMAIFTCDSQPFHRLPEGVPTFERVPG